MRLDALASPWPQFPFFLTRQGREDKTHSSHTFTSCMTDNTRYRIASSSIVKDHSFRVALKTQVEHRDVKTSIHTVEAFGEADYKGIQDHTFGSRSYGVHANSTLHYTLLREYR